MRASQALPWFLMKIVRLPCIVQKNDFLISVFPNVEIAFSVHVHDGDQLRRRTFIFKTEIYIKKNNNNNNNNNNNKN